MSVVDDIRDISNHADNDTGQGEDTFEVEVQIKLRGELNIGEQINAGNNADYLESFEVPASNNVVFKLSEKECILITTEGDVYMCWRNEDSITGCNKYYRKKFNFNSSENRFITNIFDLGDTSNDNVGKEITMNMIVEKEKQVDLQEDQPETFTNHMSEISAKLVPGYFFETDNSDSNEPSFTETSGIFEEDHFEKESNMIQLFDECSNQNVMEETKTNLSDECSNENVEGETNTGISEDITNVKSKYTCSVCGEHFLARRYYYAHYRKHTKIKPFKCNKCTESFYNYDMLVRHQRAKHNSGKFTCEICGKNFCGKETLKIHMRRHAGDKRFKCPHCEMAFVTSTERIAHVGIMHLAVKPYLCDFCGVSYGEKKTLKAHLKKHHPDGRTEPCKKCKLLDCKCKKTRTKYVHAFSGSKLGQFYFCEFCSNKFKFPSELNKHIKDRHDPKTSEPYFKCMHNCEATFATKDERRKHVIDKHNDRRRYSCDICGRKYFTASHVATHKLTHSRVKKFDCHICGKSFGQNGNLKSHMLVHCDYKVYYCEHCDKNVPISSKSQLFKNLVCRTCNYGDLKLVRSRKVFYECIGEPKPEYNIGRDFSSSIDEFVEHADLI